MFLVFVLLIGLSVCECCMVYLFGIRFGVVCFWFGVCDLGFWCSCFGLGV